MADIELVQEALDQFVVAHGGDRLWNSHLGRINIYLVGLTNEWIDREHSFSWSIELEKSFRRDHFETGFEVLELSSRDSLLQLLNLTCEGISICFSLLE